MKKVLLSSLLTTGICLVLMTACTTSKVRPSEQGFSFAVLADPRSGGDTWKNALLEIRDGTVNSEPAFTPAELIVVAGDMDPLVSRHEDYQQVFTNAGTCPVLLPVMGNHGFENDGAHFRYSRDTLIPAIPNAVRRHADSCDYYVCFSGFFRQSRGQTCPLPRWTGGR